MAIVPQASRSFTPDPVPVPGMPGESIDKRILPDLLALLDRFKLKLTDGYATSGHAAGGDHPLGLGADLVPDTARGGTWADVNAATKFASEHRDTFRFIGYDGRFGSSATPNHGEGHHLHLSWNGGGTGGSSAPLKLFSVDKDGHSIGDWATGIAGRLPIVGPLVGPGADAAGAAVDAAGSAAQATANALLDLVVGQLGEKGARIAVASALVLGGLVLIAVGSARALGLGAKAKQAGAVAAAGAELALTKGAGKGAGAKT